MARNIEAEAQRFWEQVVLAVAGSGNCQYRGDPAVWADHLLEDWRIRFGRPKQPEPRPPIKFEPQGNYMRDRWMS